ncbi:hypothetical protein [Sphingomonas sp. Leaf343]|uniref:hypothetical protein n=1 Tax=Sphingomonas sp. Leaf343 TaxID=1736345 RepID=UPI0006FB6BF6|nr:hypothetical protein [Sphingomonas sp. Leaf343]KQR82115.1 hypothetical protein ASG07_10430 [Sphingomonas sp. Leaf343]
MMSTITTLAADTGELATAWRLRDPAIADTGFRDNGTAILENDVVRFRLVSEQGSASIDIASRQEPDNWFDLSLIFNLRNGKPLDSLNAVPDLIAFAIADHDRLLNEMTVNFAEARKRLERAEQARFTLMFPDLA